MTIWRDGTMRWLAAGMAAPLLPFAASMAYSLAAAGYLERAEYYQGVIYWTVVLVLGAWGLFRALRGGRLLWLRLFWLLLIGLSIGFLIEVEIDHKGAGIDTLIGRDTAWIGPYLLLGLAAALIARPMRSPD